MGEDIVLVRTHDTKSKEGCQQNINKEPASGKGHVDENVHHASPATNPDLGKSLSPTLQGSLISFEQAPLRLRKKVISSFLAPSVQEVRSGRFLLERCMRLAPHNQDTGAFLVSISVQIMSYSVTRRQNSNAKRIDPKGETDPEESGGAIRIGEEVIRRDSAGELEDIFSLGKGSAILCCGEGEEVIAWI